MLKHIRHIRDNGTHTQKTRLVWALSILSFTAIVVVWGAYKTEEFSISASFFNGEESNEPGVIDKIGKGLASVKTNFQELINIQNTIEIEAEPENTKVRAFPKSN